MRSPHARPVTLGLATGLFVVSSGMTGTAMAAATPSASATPSETGASSTHAASTSPAVFSSTRAASTSPAVFSSTRAASTSPAVFSSTKAATPSAPAASATNSPAASPTASPSPSPSTTSPTPTPTPTATPTPTKPTVTVSAAANSVQPGGTILFRISAWSTSAENGTIATTLTPGAKTPAFSQPVFTVDSCTSNPTSTSCDLTLPAKQPAASQIEAQVSVPKTAPAGETIKFSATVSVANGSGSPLTATASAPTVTVAKAPASPSPSSSTKSASAGASPGSTAGGSNTTIPGVSGSSYTLGTSLPIGALPGVTGVPGVSTTIPAGSASSLFPQISPSSSPSPAAGGQASPGKGPVATGSVIPLSLTSSEFGAQIIGLIILLLGVAVAVTRISLRKVRSGKPGS